MTRFFLLAALFTGALTVGSQPVFALQIGVEIFPENPLPGEAISVRLIASNDGSGTESNVRLELDFSTNLRDTDERLLSDGGDCTEEGGNNSDCSGGETAFWNLGDLEPGQAKAVTLTTFSEFNLTPGDSIPFNVRVLTSGTVQTTFNRSAFAATERTFDLFVSPSADPVAPLETITYELVYGNRTDQTATSSELRFPVPAGTTFVSASDSGVLVGNEVVWSLGFVSPGRGGTRRITVQLGGNPAAGDLVEAVGARVSGTVGQVGVFSEQSATTRVGTDSGINLALDTDSNFLKNNRFTALRFTVTNPTGMEKAGVQLRYLFPDHMDAITDRLLTDGGFCTQADVTRNNCSRGEIAVWDIGTLAPGTGKTVVLIHETVVNPTSGEIVPIVAKALANGESERWKREAVRYDVGNAFSIGVDPSREPIAPGEPVTFEINVGNVSDQDITSGLLRFPVPIGATVLAIDGDGVQTGNEIAWDLGTISSGDGLIRRVTVGLESGISVGAILQSEAVEVSGISGFQAETAQQDVAVRVETLSNIDLALDTLANPTQGAIYTPFHFTLTNRTGAPLSGNLLEFFFPRGIEDVSESRLTDNGTCVNRDSSTGVCTVAERAEWELGVLAAGAGRNITFSPLIFESLPDGELIPLVARSSADDTNDRWERRSIRKDSTRSLSLAVDVDEEPVAPANQISYLLSIGNSGEGDATLTQLELPFPPDTSFVSASDDGVQEGDSVTWPIGTLTVGETAVRSAVFQLKLAPTSGQIVRGLPASLTSPDAPETEAGRSVRFRQSDRLDINLDLSPDQLVQGAAPTAEVMVSNPSSSISVDVELELFFPSFLFDLEDDEISGVGDCTVRRTASECDPGELVVWPIGILPSGQSATEMITPTVAVGNQEPPSGSLISFYARATSSSSSDGQFVTRTIRVGSPEIVGVPEMDVRGNGLSITSGATSTSASDNTSFGPVSINGQSVDRVFEIANLGVANLELTGSPVVAISGPGAVSFDVLTSPVSTIAGSEEISFAVRFTPLQEGLRTAVLSIANNDSDENPYTFTIEGVGENIVLPDLIFQDSFE